MAEWQKHTCIRFVERVNQSDYVEFYYGEGCNSDVGRAGGRQTTSLGRGCAHHGIVVHELGHLIGFWHEQNRPDRDTYITIKEENIIPKFKFAFDKYSNRKIDSLGVLYDYYSVMHYGAKAFSKNGQPTIVARQPSVKTFGNIHLSVLDIKQANLLYKCPDYAVFPRDFVWRSNGPMRRNVVCLRIFHSKSVSWRDNYLCYRKDRKSLSLRWSYRGALRGKRCIHINVPSKPSNESWDRSYLCWPHDGIYKFKWLTHAPRYEERDSCLEWSEPRDPTWGDKRYYLCATKDQQPIDGSWTRWSPWQGCSRRCGGGIQTRSRACTNPQPAFGGAYCDGDSLQRRPCNSQECAEWPSFPEDFTFNNDKTRPSSNEICVRIFERKDYFTWKNYLFCTPGDKRQLEMRWTDRYPLSHMLCTRIYVPEDSRGRSKGRWDDNYLCLPRDTGFPYRFVWSYAGKLPNLPCMRWFAKGGKDGWDRAYLCAKNASSSITVIDETINGGWSSWTSWNTCDKSCGNGTQHRIRRCDSPRPRNGGLPCQGNELDERRCNEKKCPASCGSMFEASSGTFASPGYPTKPYPNGMDCEWIIRVPYGQRIDLRFLFFNIEGDRNCNYDFVMVYDGETDSSRRIGKFCGSDIPSINQSSSNVMLVKFHSDIRRGYYGFNAKWSSSTVDVKTTVRTAVCGRKITEPSGTLSSPGYPGSYPPNVDCIWVITAPRGHYIELTFKTFDIHKDGRGCRYDYVEVRDGNSRDSPSLGRHCGTSVDDKFQTMSNHARIRLHTDGSRETQGFVLTWSSVTRVIATQEPTTKPLCPRGWVSHVMEDPDTVYCYLVRKNTHTWYLARNDCINSHSDLLSISNAKEQEFVTKHLLAESFMWIGYNDLEREGKWAWSDRTHQSYMNWATGDPNNGGTYRKKDEDCAVLKSNGKWNDYPCNTRFRYICKARASRLSVAGLHTTRVNNG
ncbi:hypothetical protein OS493_013535 [Desmophyllum pertusum]|uniref:Metalloendopeptidase n=1 Tax=Desmophyllum pertusum TaxID=174260 RepID=A0A9X0A2B3_9CNID|nr:hypothetical protein OS493_013535 [Desmophyllum pertusum]